VITHCDESLSIHFVLTKQINVMKKYVLIPLLIALMGCVTVKVNYDYDNQADFSSSKPTLSAKIP